MRNEKKSYRVLVAHLSEVKTRSSEDIMPIGRKTKFLDQEIEFLDYHFGY